MSKIISIVLLFLVACQPAQKQEMKADESLKTQGAAYIQDKDSKMNILQIAASSPDHTTLAAGVKATSLENVLANPGPLTVFAPTNAAFDKLPEGTLENLLKKENLSKLAKIITFHAAPGTYNVEKLKKYGKIYMATGHDIMVDIKDDGVYVNGSKIVASIEAANGIVHVVNDVFLPPAKK